MIGNFINIFFAFDRNILIGKISLYFCRFFQLFFIAVCNKAVIEDRSLPPVNQFNNQFLNNNSSLHYFFNQSNCKVDMFSYKKTGLSARLLTMILTLQKARKYATFRYLFLFLRHQYHRLHMARLLQIDVKCVAKFAFVRGNLSKRVFVSKHTDFCPCTFSETGQRPCSYL